MHVFMLKSLFCMHLQPPQHPSSPVDCTQFVFSAGFGMAFSKFSQTLLLPTPASLSCTWRLHDVFQSPCLCKG